MVKKGYLRPVKAALATPDPREASSVAPCSRRTLRAACLASAGRRTRPLLQRRVRERPIRSTSSRDRGTTSSQCARTPDRRCAASVQRTSRARLPTRRRPERGSAGCEAKFAASAAADRDARRGGPRTIIGRVQRDLKRGRPNRREGFAECWGLQALFNRASRRQRWSQPTILHDSHCFSSSWRECGSLQAPRCSRSARIADDVRELAH